MLHSKFTAKQKMPDARGFTLIELMIALLIGLFISAGLITLVSAMRRTTTTQSGLSQLQDNERIAMSIVADVIQSAGYYPNVTAQTSGAALPIAGAFTIAGQGLAGNEAVPHDWIYSRYLVGATDTNILNCAGGTNGTGAQLMYINRLYIDDATQSLMCELWVGGAASVQIPLVAGVTDMQIMYGVKTNSGVNNSSADTYLNASSVAAGGFWNKVLSVRITLTFANPNSTQLNQPATIDFTRVIAVMNRTGVST